MKLSPLDHWEPTSHSLHQAAQILGAIRMLTRDPVPNYLELALRIEPDGLSTERLPSGGEVRLDFERGVVVCAPKDGRAMAVTLAGRTQASLLESILTALNAQGQSLVAQKDGSFSAAFLAALQAKNHPLIGSVEIGGTQPLEVDRALGADYARLLNRVFTATARWRSRLTGFVTPVVVWPEHFDLSTLWFATDEVSESAPQMNFGFAPFDAEFNKPYLYVTAYPIPDGFEKLPLPMGARWHTQGWNGAIVPYDELARADDPEALIESVFEAVHAVLSPTFRRLERT
jgi:Family of unknown function (DUF5996)